jgi:hypothetical protein
VLDDTLLADPRALAALDTGGVLRSAATAGAQVRSAAHGAQEAGVATLGGHRPRALVLVRRPGTSGAVAGLLAALLGPGCPVPVVTVDEVPVWVGPLDRRRGRTPRTPRTLSSRTELGRAVRRAPRWCCPRPDGPAARREPGRVRLVEPRVPCHRGSTPRGLAVGSPSCRPLSCCPRRSDLDALADVLDAEAERNQLGQSRS